MRFDLFVVSFEIVLVRANLAYALLAVLAVAGIALMLWLGRSRNQRGHGYHGAYLDIVAPRAQAADPPVVEHGPEGNRDPELRSAP